MGAALTLLLILTLATVIVRVASVALRLTGLPDHVARFQARSAFTGAGFTTVESEAVVNYPIRRRIIGLLMTLGSVGFVTVFATVTVSFVSVDANAGMTKQLLWLLGAVVVLWVVALNPIADRVMCQLIGFLLRRMTSLGRTGPVKLLQMTSGYSIAEHRVVGSAADHFTLGALRLSEKELVPIGIKSPDGAYVSSPDDDVVLVPGSALVVYGAESQHEQLDLRHVTA